MNKFRSLVSEGSLNEGDIIQFRPLSAIERRTGKPAYGYVHHVNYLTQKKDDVKEFTVFPIQTQEEAVKSGKKFARIDQNIDGHMLGLAGTGDNSNPWCIVIDPLAIEPSKKGTGRNDGLVQRIGNLYNSMTFDAVQDCIQDHGGEAKLYTEGIGPKERRTDPMLFGHFTPVGIKGGKKRDAMTAFGSEVKDEKKGRKKRQHDIAGYQPDITLPNAVKAGLIAPDIAKAFKSVSGLRALKDLAKDRPEAFSEGVKNIPSLENDIALNDLSDNIPMVDDIWRVMYPKDAGVTPRLATLKQAYDFVTQEGNSLTAYQNVDQKLANMATKQIIAAYGKLSKAEDVSEGKITDAAKSIKGAWKEFMEGYSEFKAKQIVPTRFADESGAPLWTSVPVLKPKG